LRPVETNTAPVIESLAQISEVLEDQDEDMKSFGSQAASLDSQEDISKVDNNADNEVVRNEEIDEARDIVDDTGGLGESLSSLVDDKRLSRGSLGMSRWSTEENLSIGDSREVLNISDSKEEILNISGSTSDSKDGIFKTTNTTSSIHDSYSNSTDSGIQSVGSSHSAQSPEEAESTDTTPSPLSIVHKMFGGRMETCFTCQTCNNRSMFSDWFTDLHLAIPQTTTNSTSTSNKPTDQKILAQKESLKQAIDDLNSSGASTSQASDRVSEDVNMAIDVESQEQSSSQTPSITITPPLPAPNPQQLQPTANPPTQPLGVSDLIEHYLAPETLDGENQYQCNHCNMLRDAVKTTRLSAAPEYLNITLLRFKFDITTMRRAKVFTTIDYPQELTLPVTGGDVVYRLYSVVVHSGYSSDGGHYYTWARPDCRASTWLVLNDSRVTETSWAQFIQQSTKLSRDTAYLLFYQRVGGTEGEEAVPPRQKMDRVIMDNMKYLRERESASVGFQRGYKGGNSRGDDRGDSEDGSGPGAGCNDNFGQIGGGRFVF